MEKSIKLEDIMDKVTPTNFENEEDLEVIELDVSPEVQSLLKKYAKEKKLYSRGID